MPTLPSLAAPGLSNWCRTINLSQNFPTCRARMSNPNSRLARHQVINLDSLTKVMLIACTWKDTFIYPDYGYRCTDICPCTPSKTVPSQQHSQWCLQIVSFVVRFPSRFSLIRKMADEILRDIARSCEIISRKLYVGWFSFYGEEGVIECFINVFL